MSQKRERMHRWERAKSRIGELETHMRAYVRYGNTEHRRYAKEKINELEEILDEAYDER